MKDDYQPNGKSPSVIAGPRTDERRVSVAAVVSEFGIRGEFVYQFWFMDKDDRLASRLYPLTDFSPRKGEALEKGYLRARYGGVPFISRAKLH